MIPVCYANMLLTGTATLNELQGVLYTFTHIHLSK